MFPLYMFSYGINCCFLSFSFLKLLNIILNQVVLEIALNAYNDTLCLGISSPLDNKYEKISFLKFHD